MVFVHARNAAVLLAAAFLGLDFSKNLAFKTAEPIEKGALYFLNLVKCEFLRYLQHCIPVQERQRMNVFLSGSLRIGTIILTDLS